MARKRSKARIISDFLVQLNEEAQVKASGVKNNIVHVQYQLPSGGIDTLSPTAAWTKYALNTIIVNQIGEGVTLVSNKLYLPEGVYYVEGTGISYLSGNASIRLKNGVAPVGIIQGVTVFSRYDATTNRGHQLQMDVRGVMAVNAGDYIALERYYTTDYSSSRTLATGDNEILADLMVRRLD